LTDSRNISETVTSLLIDAGKKIVMPAYLSQTSRQQLKDDGSIVTETDLKCQQFLRDKLEHIFPDTGFLGEEMNSEEQKACLEGDGRFWCVDPLDGTSNFTIPLPHFALSLSLIENGSPIFACIHDPLRDESFTASAGNGAFLNGEKIRTSHVHDITQAVGFIDFKRLDGKRASKLATSRLFRSQRNIGTCALEWAWLAAGRAHFIIHGSEKIWDYAAGSLLAEEAGCIVTDFDGNYLFRDIALSRPVLAASNSEIHRRLLDELSDF